MPDEVTKKTVPATSTALGRGEWLNPLNRMIWQKAFKDKAATVEMTLTIPGHTKQKYTFECNYELWPGYVWVKAPGTFTPCGWFDLKKVSESHWISENK